MRNNISIHLDEADTLAAQQDGKPYLISQNSRVLVFFDNWKQFEEHKNQCNQLWYAFQADEEQRQISADIDDTASRDGDRNHELTMAMGGAVI